jgi:hypothetical protein
MAALIKSVLLAVAVAMTLSAAGAAAETYTCPLEVGKVTLCIRPVDTDPAILSTNNPHFVMYKEDGDPSAKLFLWLTGTFGHGVEEGAITTPMVDAGYRVISLEYKTWPNYAVWCQSHRPTDLTCPEKALRQRIYGEGGLENDNDVGPSQAIINRLVKLLQYLETRYPDQKWGRYLVNGAPDWPHITLAGQSLGADIAAYIAKKNAVARVVLFSSPWGNVVDPEGRLLVDKWVSEPGATLPDRWYGLYHKQENFAASIEEHFNALNIPESHIYRAGNKLSNENQAFLKKVCVEDNQKLKKYPELSAYCSNPFHIEAVSNSAYASRRALFFGLKDNSAFGNNWFAQDFDANFRRCTLRDGRPVWCSDWIKAMETSIPKTTDLRVPEWYRRSFPNNMSICSTLLNPPWCQDWMQAMRTVSTTPPYTNITDYIISEQSRKMAAIRERIEEWNDIIERVSQNKPTKEDLEIINKRASERDGDALEILGYMYYDGRFVGKDLKKSYEIYGRAVLAGRKDLRANLDTLWKLMTDDQRLAVKQIEEFNLSR